MHNSLRRKLLFGLAALPFAGRSIVKASISVSDDDNNGPASTLAALNGVRVVGTLENTYKHKFGKFGTREDMLEALLKSEKQRHAGGECSWVNLVKNEIAQGWESRWLVSAKKDDFLFIVKRGRRAIAGGGTGVIYQGNIDAETRIPESFEPAKSLWGRKLEGLTPAAVAQMRELSQPASFLRKVGFTGMGGSFDMDCGGTCASSAQPGCWDLGFLSCPWCCFGSMDGCCGDAARNGRKDACRCVSSGGCGCLPLGD